MPTVSRKKIAEIIRKMKGFYSVDFIKRSNGELRRMNCLNHVKKHLTGGQKNFSDEEKGLITTYSIDSEGYRSIPIEGIVAVQGEKETYRVV